MMWKTQTVGVVISGFYLSKQNFFDDSNFIVVHNDEVPVQDIIGGEDERDRFKIF